MRLSLDAEQQLLQDSVARFVADHHGFEQRSYASSGAPQCSSSWKMFAENGWLAAAVPAELGGLGGSVIDTVIIAQQLGRGLVIEPYVGCAVLAVQTLLAGGTTEQCNEWLPSLLDGSRRLALAYSELAARGMPDLVAARAERSSQGYALYARKTLVLGAPRVDGYIVSACTRNELSSCEEVSLFIVRADAPQLRAVELPMHDGTFAAELTLNGAPAEAVLGNLEQGVPALREGMSHAMLALCAELIGGMERALEITAEYLRTRKQFNAPLASFQSLQHRMADMAAELELARSMLLAAMASHVSGAPTARYAAASAAKAFVTRAARRVCGEAIQLHGAIGMAEECVVGHYFKRAVVADLLLGSSGAHEAVGARCLQQQFEAEQAQRLYRLAP